jgi:hypothetical protein
VTANFPGEQPWVFSRPPAGPDQASLDIQRRQLLSGPVKPDVIEAATQRFLDAPNDDTTAYASAQAEWDRSLPERFADFRRAPIEDRREESLLAKYGDHPSGLSRIMTNIGAIVDDAGSAITNLITRPSKLAVEAGYNDIQSPAAVRDYSDLGSQ